MCDITVKVSKLIKKIRAYDWTIGLNANNYAPINITGIFKDFMTRPILRRGVRSHPTFLGQYLTNYTQLTNYHLKQHLYCPLGKGVFPISNISF